MDTEARDDRMHMHLYGTLTHTRCMLHAQETAYLLPQPPPWLMMPTHVRCKAKWIVPHCRQRFIWSV